MWGDPTAAPQISSWICPAPAIHHLIYSVLLRLSYQQASLLICDTCHQCEGTGGSDPHLALPPAPP